MSVTVAAVRTTASTSTGNQDITTSDLGGLTPKAVYFVITGTITNDVAAAHSRFGIGAATGASNRWAICVLSENNQSTSDTWRYARNDECILIFNTTGTIDGQADFVSFITNGVRINWSNAPSSAFHITAVFFAGDDVTAHANTFTVGNQNVATDVTDPGFEPDVLLTATNGRAFNISVTGQNDIAYGCVYNQGGGVIDQQFIQYFDQDAAGTSSMTSYFGDAHGIGQVDFGSVTWRGEFSDFDANGFSCTPRDGNGSSDGVGYLALNFNGATSIFLDTIDTPISTGNDSQAGIGFTPQAIIAGCSLRTAVNTVVVSGAGVDTAGLAVFTSTVEYCSTQSGDDDLGTTDTQCLSSDSAIVIPQEDGSVGIVASFVSFDANGYTLNYTDVLGSATKLWVLAIEEVSGVPSAPTTIEASDGTFASKVRVTWSASSGATSYKVYQAPTAIGTKTLIGTTSNLYLDDETVTPGTIYYYFVVATNAEGDSVYSGYDTGYALLIQLGLIPSQSQTKELSILVSDSLTKTDRTTLGRITPILESYNHEIRSTGGYYSAKFAINGNQKLIEDWIEYGIGRHIKVYNPVLEQIWEGFVNKITARLGPLTFSIGPLMNIANKVAVVYSTSDTSTSPPTLGIREVTSFANDTDSQNQYGIIETIRSRGGTAQTLAEQERDTFLEENSQPKTSRQLNLSGDAKPSVSIECLGYWHWLKLYTYSNTGSGTQDLDAKIQAVINAELNSIFSTDFSKVDSNTLAVSVYDDKQRKAESILKELNAYGDANNNRYTIGFYNDRQLVYRVAPSEIQYQERITGNRGVTNRQGREVEAWDVNPAEWLYFPDFLIGRESPITTSTLNSDPRTGFIETVKFTAPNGLSVNGEKISSLDQVLAKASIQGES